MLDALAARGIEAAWESTGGGCYAIISAPYTHNGVAHRLFIGESGGDLEHHHERTDEGRTGWFIQREEVDYGGRYQLLVIHASLDMIDLIVDVAAAEVNA